MAGKLGGNNISWLAHSPRCCRGRHWNRWALLAPPPSLLHAAGARILRHAQRARKRRPVTPCGCSSRGSTSRRGSTGWARGAVAAHTESAGWIGSTSIRSAQTRPSQVWACCTSSSLTWAAHNLAPPFSNMRARPCSSVSLTPHATHPTHCPLTSSSADLRKTGIMTATMPLQGKGIRGQQSDWARPCTPLGAESSGWPQPTTHPSLQLQGARGSCSRNAAGARRGTHATARTVLRFHFLGSAKKPPAGDQMPAGGRRGLLLAAGGRLPSCQPARSHGASSALLLGAGLPLLPGSAGAVNSCSAQNVQSLLLRSRVNSAVQTCSRRAAWLPIGGTQHDSGHCPSHGSPRPAHPWARSDQTRPPSPLGTTVRRCRAQGAGAAGRGRSALTQTRGSDRGQAGGVCEGCARWIEAPRAQNASRTLFPPRSGGEP